jgi:hypothetical protein
MSSAVPADPGFVARLREAYGTIVWKDASTELEGGAREARIAHLHDEEARIETWETPRGAGVAVTSGPVGALVLLVEIDRRGAPQRLGARNAGRDPVFPDGSVVATWGEDAGPLDSTPRLRDLVELARYALG